MRIRPWRSSTAIASSRAPRHGPATHRPVDGSKIAPCVEQTKYSPVSSKNSPGCQSSSTPEVRAAVHVGARRAVVAHGEALALPAGRRPVEAHARAALGQRGRLADHACRCQPLAQVRDGRGAVPRRARAQQRLAVRAVADRHGIDAGVGGELQVVGRVADHERRARARRRSPRGAAAACPDAASGSPRRRSAWPRRGARGPRRRARGPGRAAPCRWPPRGAGSRAAQLGQQRRDAREERRLVLARQEMARGSDSASSRCRSRSRPGATCSTDCEEAQPDHPLRLALRRHRQAHLAAGRPGCTQAMSPVESMIVPSQSKITSS